MTRLGQCHISEERKEKAAFILPKQFDVTFKLDIKM